METSKEFYGSIYMHDLRAVRGSTYDRLEMVLHTQKVIGSHTQGV